MATPGAGGEQSQSQFDSTPEGWAQRWAFELKTAREAMKDFYEVAKAVDAELRDESRDNGGKRLCLAASNHRVLSAMLFGRTPQASVSRKFADADDDEARVASEMLERVLNCDIERADDTFTDATKNAMTDWLGPGLGANWHRYELGPMETVEAVPAKVGPDGLELAPEVPAQERPSYERVDTDYVRYDAFLYGQCQVWHEVPWVARKAKMSREALVKRFGEIAERVPLNAKHVTSDDSKENERAHPWDRADVWEIWHKETKKVFWYVEGFHRVLDMKDDPLGLTGFFPCQRPLMANLTTSKLIPVADFKFTQDLYNTANTLYTRISVLVGAVRVAGAYPKQETDIIEKLVSGGDNKLYPVDSWAAFAEKGGMKGIIDWLPLEQIQAVLQALSLQLAQTKDLIFEIEGLSDLIRGQQTANGTPGEARIKAKSASVKIQSKQDEIARFASDGQRIRAEIISRHFQPNTIIEHSNVMRTPDAPMAQKAAELIKSRFLDYRIEIKPEAINLTDFAALKEERTEVLSAIGDFMQKAAPLAGMGPPGMKFAAKLLQVTVSGLKGASAYESIIDQFIAEMEQAAQAAAANPQQQQPDPKIVAQQMKGQQDQQKIQAELQADLVRTQADVNADAQREQNQMRFNVQEHAAKTQMTAAMKPPEPTGGIPK